MIRDGGFGDHNNGEDCVGGAVDDTSSSDKASSTEIHSEDGQDFMEYGSEGSELSHLLDEELNRVK